MSKYAMGIGIVFSLSISIATLNAENVHLIAKSAKGAIVIDGELSDPGWQGAGTINTFHYLGSDTIDTRRAKVTVTYDDKNLYVGMSVFGDNVNPSDFGAEQKKKDTYAKGPMAEIWLDVGYVTGSPRRNSYHICANARGVRYDELIRGGSDAWDGKWRHAGRLMKDHWTVELAIPFREIGLTECPIGLPIGAQFGRAFGNLSSWTGGWYEMDEYGLIFFGTDKKYREAAKKKLRKPGPPEVYYVDTKGNDNSPGTPRKPFRTVQKAVDIAGPGDTIVVRPGLYRERIVVGNKGTADKPLIIEGERGATLHGGDIAKGWKHLGNGLYKTENLPYQPLVMIWNDHFVLHVRKQWAGEYIDAGKLYLFGNPKPEDWDGIEVLFTSDADQAWVRTRNNENPNEHQVTLAPRANMGGATVTLKSAKHVILRGFVIKGGDAGVYMKRASDNIIENNFIAHGKNGIHLHYRCHRNTIRNNYITIGAYGEMNRVKAGSRISNNIVRIIKGDGRRDHHGILLERSGHDNEFCYNKIFQHWDGVKVMSIRPTSTPEQVEIESQAYSRGFKVHHNIICDCWDYAIEPCGGEVDAEYHHNLIYGCPGAVRVKNIGTGPMYFYNNIITQTITSFYVSNQNQCRIYVYHNTFAGSRGISIHQKVKRIPKSWWFINNILSNPDSTMDCWKNHTRDYHFDYSYVGNNRFKHKCWYEGPSNVLGFKLLWEPGTPGTVSDFRIGKDWPVREKGIDLSKPWKLDGVKHEPLRGMTKGYFSGKAPDLGALQLGEAMPKVGPQPIAK